MSNGSSGESDQPAQVGIVVAALNAAEYLAATLNSIQAQSMPNWLCVVVDDGSTDDTAQIASRFANRDQRFSVYSQANAGLPSARNTGIAALSESRWLAFIDSDDTWLPDALEALCAAADERPDAVAVYGLAEYMDEAGRPMRLGEHPATQRDRRQPGRLDLRGVDTAADGTFAVVMVSGTIWPPAVGIYDRRTVVRAGLFDPQQRFVEDWDLYVRMSRFGPFVPIDRQVAWYRQHPAGMTRREVEMAYYYARVRWKAYTSPHNSPTQRRLVRRVWASLQIRSVLWTATAAARAIRSRDWATSKSALAACGVFTAELLAGRPAEPTERAARHIARFIASRRSKTHRGTTSAQLGRPR